MFSIQSAPDNAVAKSKMYMFKDMDDYKSRRVNFDNEYAAYLATIKKRKHLVLVLNLVMV